ncbi:hypothetical protein J6590_023386 [Homalodisca vitripennis]|nr:hypothetical protein J6590_023386 [Homalodisca vitripennis]
MMSGLLNFCAVALALNDLGYRAVGIRIDSGDLAYLSNKARECFVKIATKYNIPWFSQLQIVASNDINEETILSLNEQGHKIDCFGIGTHLVTCQRQPALGCVYKMVEVNGVPRIKLSQDVGKVTMPGRKDAYRLYGADGHALIDLLQRSVEPPPEVGARVLCRHPFQESKRAYVIPTHVEALYKVYWQNGRMCQPQPSLKQVRDKVKASLQTLRQDHKRNLNPTPYKNQYESFPRIGRAGITLPNWKGLPLILQKEIKKMGIFCAHCALSQLQTEAFSYGKLETQRKNTTKETDSAMVRHALPEAKLQTKARALYGVCAVWRGECLDTASIVSNNVTRQLYFDA